MGERYWLSTRLTPERRVLMRTVNSIDLELATISSHRPNFLLYTAPHRRLGLTHVECTAIHTMDNMEVDEMVQTNGDLVHRIDTTQSLKVLEHLVSLIETNLGIARRELESVGSLLSGAKTRESLERCRQYAEEPQVALYAQRDSLDQQANGHDDDEEFPAQSVSLTSNFNITPATTASIAFLKRPLPLDLSRPLANQIFAINLPGAAHFRQHGQKTSDGIPAFEFLHSIVHNTLGPYFDAHTRPAGTAGQLHTESDAKTGVSGARRRMVEYENSLLSLVQNTDIPLVHLPIHEIVSEALDRARQNGEPITAVSLIDNTLMQDSSLQISIVNLLNDWIKSIRTVTRLADDPDFGTASQEINFWLSLESALRRIEDELQSDGVRLTKDVLSVGKRYQAINQLENDTNLRLALDKVRDYNVLMRDFPLEELTTATTLPRTSEALDQIFKHINKKLRVCQYPLKRALKMVEAISVELEEQIHRVVHGRSLMSMSYESFRHVVYLVESVWSKWEWCKRDFTNVARDVMKKRPHDFVPIKTKDHHTRTQERLSYINTFRVNHEQLQRTIQNVLVPQGPPSQLSDATKDRPSGDRDAGDNNALHEVQEAYEGLKEIDALDVSARGLEAWMQAEAQYVERTSRVENSIIVQLRERLATARSANEMFRVFARFNALLVRPKIRGAIGEYQSQLLETVKCDINALQERFKQRYGGSEAQMMAQLRDIPPVAGSIIWVRQIEAQLNGYMERVETVLGEDYTKHADGLKLQNESDLFRQKLNPRVIFQNWTQAVQKSGASVDGRLFVIVKARGVNGVLELHVNFDEQVVALFKEVRNLVWLNFSVPNAISTVAKEAQRVYPYALSLMESVKVYSTTMRTVQDDISAIQLTSSYVNDVQHLIEQGIPLKWTSYINSYTHYQKQKTHKSDDLIRDADRTLQTDSSHARYIRDLSLAVLVLQEKVNTVKNVETDIADALKEMRTCQYRADLLQAQCKTVQNAVDKLNLENFANLDSWVWGVNQQIESILRDRLNAALRHWTQVFETGEAQSLSAHSGNDATNTYTTSFQYLDIEINMSNQSIFVDPPINFVRAVWMHELETCLSISCSIPLIKSARYQVAAAVMTQQGQQETFSYLAVECIPTLESAYSAIQAKMDELEAYLEEWYRYQSLWDLQISQLHDTLQEDLGLWHRLTLEVRHARSTFDTSDVRKTMGFVNLNYEQVQAKTAQKYDQWQTEITTRFGAILENRMREVFAELKHARTELESHSLEASSTAQAVAFITVVQQSRRNANVWEPEIEVFRQSQTTLSRQRYNFPSDWLAVTQLSDEWEAFREILSRKVKVVEEQTDALRAKIAAEDRSVNEKIVGIAQQWSDEKPVSGTVAPNEALDTLKKYQLRLENLRQESEIVLRAKEALGLYHNINSTIATLMEEVQDFMSVWAALSTIWQNINDLRDMLWASMNPRKLRASLEGLVKTTKEMPSRMRQYAAFEYVRNVLKDLQKSNSVLTDLKTDAIRERHWVKIYKALRPGKRYSEISMTLGDVWDLKPVVTEAVIRDIITQAQGELALEEFVKQVRDTWQTYSLDLVNYQNKLRLIRGWDEIFTKCSENLSSLQAMRHSPYYKEFEEEATSWEDKLNRVHVLFDVWIDVQRQWVYLEGVFSGNNDIKHLLPTESSRFFNINTEFYALMKKVYKSPQVMDVVSIPGVQKSLDRLAELLSKIQKALGEYLERERVSFPRFYFVGDEDLLEIIGNSNETSRVAKHFKKLFAGISGVETGDENTITAVTSKEGERVVLKKEVSLVKTPKINEWLAALDTNTKLTLAELLSEAVAVFEPMFVLEDLDVGAFHEYLQGFPAQIVILAAQVVWTKLVEESLMNHGADLQKVLNCEIRLLEILAESVLHDLPSLTRRKCEHFITEAVHQRDVIDKLIRAEADTPGHYAWLLQMRYIYARDAEPLHRLHIEMANARLEYGYEYLGVPDRLVRTPLTDRCFLTLTQALCQRLGGSPYGPAGTGKTESVKALGLQLGRFTLVFCCDDTFDFQAVGRIFLGICQVGAWGCFDEFNRLEERILSAVSQQIQNIQIGLRNSTHEQKAQIELVGRQLKVNENTGIFITMNPGYAGRSNLPDNLKKLFRSVAMSKPDKELIAEVMLFSQGFKQAKGISKQVVPFFNHAAQRLSKQPHYDFGLRALKSVLVSSGSLKRTRLQSSTGVVHHESILEPQILVQSIRETVSPKLIKDDVARLINVQQEDFPGVEYVPADLSALRAAIEEVMKDRQLTMSDAWMTKILQLHQIQRIHHGVMMVGQSGSGKSEIWKVLLQALQRVEGVEGVCHIIEPKVMSKEALYGSLDATTREWTDGLFTTTLRKIVDNLRGEDTKRHWIVFDGDVDPEWVENLNSVLDDNKLLTLPNGERLSLPSNVRIMFEVENLKYATLATVSRCGMVWFSDDTVTPAMMIDHYIAKFASRSFDDIEDEISLSAQSTSQVQAVQTHVTDTIRNLVIRDSFLVGALGAAAKYKHIMEFTTTRVLDSLFSLLSKTLRTILQYNSTHSDFPLEEDQVKSYVSKKTLIAVVWSLVGDTALMDRKAFGEVVGAMTDVELPTLDGLDSLIDYDVALPVAQWVEWKTKVPTIDVNTHSITQTDVIIPTVDTVRHEEVLYSWLAEHKPLMLCGPPGSGKTMTLFSALRKLPDMEVVGLNFSSATMPDLIVKTFEQYCEYKKTSSGLALSPTQIGKWLVIFCDEINLPAPDKYGTQRAISFLRQLIEQNGFWRTTDKQWVTLDRIQFVGACNPPEDVGRHPLGARFLRHAPVVMVGYPGELSLTQIYGTFNSAVLKVIPSLRGFAEPLTKAMVDFYLKSQAQFTADIQPHYIYSPRELTRWVRGIYESIAPLDSLTLEGLIRIWAHEALRLFSDRLVEPSERAWTKDLVRQVATECFPMADIDTALLGPILFSNWLTKNYVSVDQEQLREFVKARLRTFCEEEVDTPLVLFNDVLEHALRIDRVFRQPQGHLILIGTSGSGKTTLSRFVAWMNGLKIFQIKVHGRYSAEDFDDDLRGVLRACGTRSEKICFIMDESNVLDSGFLERMNTLLANGEVPGLFEGDEYSALMTACKDGAQRQGLLLDSQEELYKWFTQQIVRNLHVVFTMNPPQEGLSSKAATSPALFNRCVLNWMGDWSDQALFQVGHELTQSVDLDRTNYSAPDSIPVAYSGLNLPASHRDAVINAMVHVHHSVHRSNKLLKHYQGLVTYLTPRHYLDFVDQFTKLFREKREDLEDQQRHLNVGLDKLRDTVDKVRDLRTSLAEKQKRLSEKDAEANDKLQRMVAGQRDAESKKIASQELKAYLDKQQRDIAERQQIVEADLAQAEPAVLEAQQSVSNIKRQHLTEVRSMANPPAGVKLALDSVCTLLGENVPTWKDIQAVVRKDDFIAKILNYNNEESMTAGMRKKMKDQFLSSDDFTYEKVNRASKACGPLVSWVTAQVRYSEILNKVGPLRAEVNRLEADAFDTVANARATDKIISELETNIMTYKREYATLISETEAIKSEMSQVQSKVDRSVRLLDSLSSERGRWEEASKSFETQMQTLVGDVLVASAFLAYAGLYDQQFRKNMLDDWSHQLRQSNISCKMEGSILGYLSSADERLRWQRNSLPADDLCMENAIMLKRFNRYPLIIDPSSRVTEYLQREHEGRKLTITSFLDDAFIKQLESALRFGNPILIQDAEHLDPILTHVLNKEYQKTGGRVLIQLGKQEIDFSPSFKLYLSTRDPSVNFAPDVCSRTTLINFTVTRSSLQTQSLNEVLRAERPDVDKRRTNLIKMQGEFNTNLRQLEKRLLQALNESRGNILDDDHVIHTLETLKKEAVIISKKVAETQGVMIEVERITQEYSRIADACSAIFAVLEVLHHINHVYRFSLQYFVDIFHHVLQNNKHLDGVTDYRARGEIILKDIFIETYHRTAISMYQKDKTTLALLLARATPYEFEKNHLEIVLTTPSTNDVDLVTAVKACPPFMNAIIDTQSSQWETFMSQTHAEQHVPRLWQQEVSMMDESLLNLLLVKLARPDRLLPAAEKFVLTVFGPSVFTYSDGLEGVIREVRPGTAIALMSNPGFDASYKVDALVERSNAVISNVAMGSDESISQADRAISAAASGGTWVLIKNVHLASSWLQSLEKRLSSLKPHEDFRLFLSMETSSKLPVNLLRASRTLVFEQPAGLRANMRDTLTVLSDRGTQAPVEKGRLYLLLCFLHAVLQERLRYAPALGWKSLWEFNDSDYECCAYIIDCWIEYIARGRSNIAPVKVPWELLRTMVTEMYGGKIDDEEDFQMLSNLVDRVFDASAYEVDHELVRGEDLHEGLKVPPGTSMKDFRAWVDALPEREPPSYLGLPEDAEKVLLAGQGQEVLRSVARVVELLEEGEVGM